MDEVSAQEQVLFDLVEEITNKLQAGEPVDLDRYATEYPDYVERLLGLLPSLEVFADFGSSSAGGLLDSGIAQDSVSLKGTLGEYKIVREIGRGGMGVVYESKHVSLGRRVALKVLPFAAMLDQRQIQRFKNEAQAVAQLDHPHIVDVFGVGCDRGVHYYAMRFIDGRTLAEMVVELRQNSLRRSHQADAVEANSLPVDPSEPTHDLHQDRDDTPPLASFSTKASTKSRAYFLSIADLIRQVADALHHAHEQGVIHRDIKPSNLMLESNGKVWVTDFGLAHIESSTTLTMTGDVLGTMRYMSPEQARGVPVDHRTDIYSLGTTLYELLTLRPTFIDQDRQELSRKIAFEEPAGPRQFNRAVPADLETIALKAIEKNPAERYETAHHLAQDLRRSIHDRPIVARRPTLLDRAAKWSRRHKSLVSATAAVVLISTIALAISTVLIANSASVARQERNDANTQWTRAEANERLALEALDEMYIELFENRFPRKQLTPTDQALLKKALGFYEAFAAQNQQYEESRHETAKAYRRVGDIYFQLGRHTDAEAAYQESISFYRALWDDNSNDLAFAYGVASSTNSLGNALQGQSRHSDAEAAYRQALEIQLDLVDRSPGRPEFQEESARTYNNLGVLLTAMKNAEQAEQSFFAARRLWQKLADQLDLPAYQNHLATSHVNLANLWQETDRATEASEALNAAVEISQRLMDSSAKPEYQEQLARCLNSIGVLQLRAKQTSESESSFRSAAPLWQGLITEFAFVPEYQEELALTCRNLALLLGDKPEAADWHRRRRDTLDRLLKSFPDEREYRENLAETNGRLGALLKKLDRLPEAGEAYTDASQHWKRLNEDFPLSASYQQQLAKTYNALGIIYSNTGRPEEAKTVYRNALFVLEQMSDEQAKLPGHQSAVGKACHNLGLLLSQAEVQEAEEYLNRGQNAFAGLHQKYPTSGAYEYALADSCAALGELMLKTGRRAKAEQWYGQALELREQLVEKYPQQAALQNSLAWLLVGCPIGEIRNPARSLEHAQRAVTLSPKIHGFWNTLGVAQYRSGDWEAAVKSLKQAQKLSAAVESADWFFLAMSYEKLGEKENASLRYEQACLWMEKNKPQDIELLRFREEAEALLKTNGRQGGL